MSNEKDFFDITELIDDYYADTISLLDNIVDLLLKIDREIEQSPESILEIKGILGPLHTIKGSSGMLGFSSLQKYVHEVEGIIKSYVEDPDFEIAPQLLDFLFDVEKKIREAVAYIKKKKEDYTPLQRETDEILRGKEDLKSFLSLKKQKSSSQQEEESVSIHRDTQLIKVDFSKLDRQINLLGELIIYRTRLDQIESLLLQKHGRDPELQELLEVSQAMGKKITELQEAIMSLRLLPIKNVFTAIPRIVREESKKSGKKVEVVIRGEETELDKSVIDRLHEPIMHIIRNAVDHGIEPPDERIKKGKEPAGKIIVSARQESNFIIIDIEDDGRGIDVESVYQTAIEKGLIERGKRPPDREIINLIFAPGFSTRKVATTTSGRGVGLEVVAEVISSLGGSIEVNTAPDVGTTFTIKIPLTLAIITALMVQVHDELYAIPTSAVLESIKIRKSDIRIVRGKTVFLLRGSVIPLVFLSEIVDLPLSANDEIYVVIVGKNDQKLGLGVERLVGQQEIVIKSLDETIDSPIIAGATILGNGRVVLILDITAILSETEDTRSSNVYRIL